MPFLHARCVRPALLTLPALIPILVANIAAADDCDVIRQRSLEWVRGWDFGGDAGAFDFDAKLATFYPAKPGAVVCHDGNDPDRHVSFTASEHAAIFAELFEQRRIVSVRNRLDRVNLVECDGRLGFCSLIATATFETADGQVDAAPILYSLLWKRDGDRWLIASEHGTQIARENIAPGPRPHLGDTVTVHLRSDGTLRLDGRPIDRADLSSELRALVGDSPKVTVAVLAHRSQPASGTTEIVRAVQEAGIASVRLSAVED